jgi:PAS domain S-box-containing protein
MNPALTGVALAQVALPKPVNCGACYSRYGGMAASKPADRISLRERDLNAAVIDTMGGLVVILDCEGRLVRFNRACERTTGYSAEEVIGTTFSDLLIAPEEVEPVQAVFAGLRAGQFPNTFENFWFTKSGERRWIAWSNTALLDERGEVEYVIATGIDMTERRRAEESLREHERQLGAVVSALTSYLDSGDWNQSSATLLRSAVQQTESEYGFLGVRVGDGLRILSHHGVAADGPAAEQLAELVRAHDRDGYLLFTNFRNLFGEVLTTARSVISNHVATDPRSGGRLPPGHMPLHTFLGVPLLRGGEVIGMIGVANRRGGYGAAQQGAIEILTHAAGVLYESYRRVEREAEFTAERERAESLEREREALRHAVGAMERVLGVVGHELRTPLTAMRALAEFLMSDEARQMQEWEVFLRSLHDEVCRMSDTVDTLLEAARLNSGRARWNWAEFSLQQACNDALEPVRPLLDASRVQLTLAVDPPIVTMHGDADAVRRLVLNLVTNARKHTTDGSISVNARVFDEAGVRWAEISIADTGHGIAPEIVTRLGDAFALNSGVVGSSYVDGAGLGLAICKGILAAHGGSMRVESVVGQGTTVTATLRADLSGPTQLPGKIEFVESE